MEKEQNSDKKTSEQLDNQDEIASNAKAEITEDEGKKKTEENNKTSEEIILELEDKLTRTFAEMENQRRRFEKEKEEAFEYGGFTLAKETLNLLDNLERSKKILETDESLKNSEALKKIIEHLEIINKDLLSIF